MAYSWETKSLQELEGNDWSSRSYGSHVIRTCHSIRQKPVRDLSIEELRLAVGQAMGLKFLLPVALQRVAENAFASGDFFPGDLLLAILGVPTAVWASSPPLGSARAELAPITKSFLVKAEEMDDI